MIASRTVPAPGMLLVPLALALASCLPDGDRQAVDADPTGASWLVEEELRIGEFEGSPEYTFGQIRAVLPGPWEGLWVLDSQLPELRLYDASGRFVRAVGGRGEGPGEFSGNVCAFAGPDGEIWVEDSGRRWQRFDGSGELVGTLRSTSNLGCGIRRWTPDGRFYAVGIERTGPPPAPGRAYFIEHRFGPDGELVPGDTLFVPDLPEARRVTLIGPDSGPRLIVPIPFADRPLWVLGAGGDFLVTSGDGTYRIERRTARGELRYAIERPHTPIPVPDTVWERAVRDFQPEGFTAESGFDVRQVPRLFPPFDRFEEATDGTLWVWRRLDGGATGLDVFAPDGSYLGAADVPVDFDRMAIHHVTGEKMYGVALDELDVPYAVRLGIRRPAR